MKLIVKNCENIVIYSERRPFLPAKVTRTATHPLYTQKVDQNTSATCSPRWGEKRTIPILAVLFALIVLGYSWFDTEGRAQSFSEKKNVFRRPMPSFVSPSHPKIFSQGNNNSAHSDTLRGETPSYKAASNKERLSPMAPTLFERALAHQKNHQFKEAKSLYFALLEQSPNHVSVQNNLGAIYIKEKNFRKALEVLEQAIQTDPSYADSFYNLACLYALQKDVTRSLTYLEKAIHADDTIRSQAAEDADLESLRHEEQFKVLLAKEKARMS